MRTGLACESEPRVGPSRAPGRIAFPSYHLFYADGEGRAGTDLTFFLWPKMEPGGRGIGLTNEVALAAPVGTLGYRADRLRAHGVGTRMLAVG